MSEQPSPADPPVSHPDTSIPVVRIDLDRFCTQCGYNLRMQPVVPDPRTSIPIVRCPECGGYLPANDAATALRPWLDRLTTLFLGVWVLTVIAGIIMIIVAEASITYAVLDEFTIPGGYTAQRVNNRTIYRWSGNSGPMQSRLHIAEDWPELALILGISTALAFVGGLCVVVCCPHWRRLAYVATAVICPVIAALVVTVVWREEAPHLLGWGMNLILTHMGVHLAGGIVGILAGRSLARLAVRIVLPRSIRPRLAYLWMADGLDLPRGDTTDD